MNTNSPRARIVEVPAEHSGQRIDNYLINQLKGVPKSHIYRLLRSGQVRVNSGRKKPHYRLQTGDNVRIPPLHSKQQSAVTVPDTVLAELADAIVYQDADLLVLNKPAGLAVHAGSGVRYGVIEALRQLFPDAPFLELAHRLDRDTSGCLLLARNRDTLIRVHSMLREPGSGLHKDYLALVAGHWPGEHTVDLPLTKIRRGGEHEVQVATDGDHARSHFSALRLFDDASLMRVRIDTGRTHQIRVHAAYSGHAIAGDSKYGDSGFNRLMKGRGLQRLFLHAEQLSIPLPQGTITVQAPLPAPLKQVIETL